MQSRWKPKMKANWGLTLFLGLEWLEHGWSQRRLLGHSTGFSSHCQRCQWPWPRINVLAQSTASPTRPHFASDGVGRGLPRAAERLDSHRMTPSLGRGAARARGRFKRDRIRNRGRSLWTGATCRRVSWRPRKPTNGGGAGRGWLPGRRVVPGPGARKSLPPRHCSALPLPRASRDGALAGCLLQAVRRRCSLRRERLAFMNNFFDDEFSFL